jgi:hypothetical protein
MLYQSVRESFLSLEVVGSMYKFKVMPVDERHHRFIVMIDVAKSFVTARESRTKSFAALEAQMRTHTYKRFGVLIAGTYWRISETEESFDRFVRASDKDESVAKRRTVLPPAAEHTDEPTAVSLSRQGHDQVSDNEAKAFMEALDMGRSLPVVNIGELVYQTDLSPLDEGIMIGGTQYGKLN